MSFRYLLRSYNSFRLVVSHFISQFNQTSLNRIILRLVRKCQDCISLVAFSVNSYYIYSSFTVTNNHNWSSRSFWMGFFLCCRLIIHALISYSQEKLTFKLISNSFYCQIIKIWLQYPTMKVLLIVICVANQIKQ